MAKIDVTRAELVWPGKYNEDGTLREVPRVNLPFQVIETVNESRATREAKRIDLQASLFDFYEGKEGDTFEDGWKNKLIWGDNLLVMGSLLEKFAGKIDLIYIDPPFFTGVNQLATVFLGEGNTGFEKEASITEDVAYRNAWRDGAPSFMTWIRDRLSLMRDLLKPSGMIFIRFDQYWSHSVKLIADEVFGRDSFQNEIAVKRTFKNVTGQGRVSIPLATDSLFLYFRTDQSRFVNTLVPREKTRPGFWRRMDDSSGVRRPPERRIHGKVFYPPPGKHFKFSQATIDNKIADGKVRLNPKTGKPEYWVEESSVKPLNSNWTDIPGYSFTTAYPTENSEVLLQRVIEVASRPNALVADFFGGSGTTAAVAEKLGRRWITCDVGRFSTHTIRKRLLDIENCRPFEVLNLGKYERQYWQGVTFGGRNDKSPAEKALYEYLAFILKLYGAQPVAGLEHLHGKKGKAMVHIGAVDAPVTIDEIGNAVAECTKLMQDELHVLGWEWEMGLQNLVVTEAQKEGVKLTLLQIPREVMEQQAVGGDDLRFFELAYLKATVEKPQELAVQVRLKDFVIPNSELIPDEMQDKVTKWSDYIDYWAVDWDFRNDTFMQGWVAYRTRKDRTLPLTTDTKDYKRPGRYRALVKVIDIFGNDTSQALDIEVN
ncbi:MAG: site-specific DNA-methyltransferase [Gemmatimonadota bacterium]|nr:site-specific DNA-methyltransferase [Gemmatimonadota bacterium]